MQQARNLQNYKPLTNVADFITFNFEDWKEGEGQYGKWYRFEITHKGEAKVWFPNEYIFNIIKSLPKRDQVTIQVLKYETDDRKTRWKIMDHQGNEIKSNGYTPQHKQTSTVPQNNASSEVLETIEKMRNAFKGIDLALKSAEKKIVELEDRIKILENPLTESEQVMWDALNAK